VLSPGEEKAFDELQRHYTDGSDDLRPPRSPRRTPSAFVVLWWISLLLVIVGATVPGLAMAAAVGLGWLLWRYVPEWGDFVEAASEASDDAEDRAPR